MMQELGSHHPTEAHAAPALCRGKRRYQRTTHPETMAEADGEPGTDQQHGIQRLAGTHHVARVLHLKTENLSALERQTTAKRS